MFKFYMTVFVSWGFALWASYPVCGQVLLSWYLVLTWFSYVCFVDQFHTRKRQWITCICRYILISCSCRHMALWCKNKKNNLSARLEHDIGILRHLKYPNSDLYKRLLLYNKMRSCQFSKLLSTLKSAKKQMTKYTFAKIPNRMFYPSDIIIGIQRWEGNQWRAFSSGSTPFVNCMILVFWCFMGLSRISLVHY